MSSDLFMRSSGMQPAKRKLPDTDASGLFRDDGAVGKKRIREAEVMAALEEVPALSHVVSQILTAAGGAHSSAGEMEALVKQDMVITGRLLKLVNSPFYGLPNPIVSITQGVAIIGMSSLRSLVVAASCSSLLQVDLSGYGYEEGGLWKNSLATGALAREIALLTGHNSEEAEEYFLAGLLRDIGMLVLSPFLGREGGEIHRGDNDMIYRERQILGFDHCWAGGKVSEKWNLPDNLHSVILHHHQIPTDVDPKTAHLLVSIRIAERLAYKSRIGVVEDHPFEVDIDGRLLRASRLHRDRFSELIQKVPDVIESAAIDMSD